MDGGFESPIEERFYAAWNHFLHWERREIVVNLPIERYLEVPEVQALTIAHTPFDFILPQHHIGSYRVDFVLGRARAQHDESSQKWVLRRLPMIVIECDGHDFHERTKEQAQRDKSRDRELQVSGFRVLRFTGSEIHRNVARCVRDVEVMFHQLLYPNIEADFSRGWVDKGLEDWIKTYNA